MHTSNDSLDSAMQVVSPQHEPNFSYKTKYRKTRCLVLGLRLNVIRNL